MKNLVTGLMLAGMLLMGGVPALAQEPDDTSTTTTTTVDTAPVATPDVNVDVQTTTIPAEPSFDVNVQAPPVTNSSTTTSTTERTERTVLQPITPASSTTDSSTVLMLVGGGLAILIILALVAMAVNRNDTHTRTVVSDRREVVR